MAVTRSQKKRPLPRGPHDLTREEVERSQRGRLLQAMVEVVAEKGYANTAVADVLEQAGVSRATFYALFKDKDDCFRAAFETAAAQVAQFMAAGMKHAAAAAQGSPKDRHPLVLLEKLLTVYLETLASQPALARTFLVEVFAAGPKAIEQRRKSMETFVTLMAETHRGQPGPFGTNPEQRFAVWTIANGVSSMVTSMVGVGEARRLPELKEPLMKLAEELTGRKRP
ncbi:MAG: TetR/AcrR family transcriptional regulator [Bdellovibrionota bacterium]